MKFNTYLKLVGMKKICKMCSYDLTVIRNHIVRETDVKAGSSQLWVIMKKFKKYMDNATSEHKQSPRIREIIRKLRGED